MIGKLWVPKRTNATASVAPPDDMRATSPQRLDARVDFARHRRLAVCEREAVELGRAVEPDRQDVVRTLADQVFEVHPGFLVPSIGRRYHGMRRYHRALQRNP